MINQPLKIDIAFELSRFDIHLNNNPRTILSAKFGDGKTYFLRRYMQDFKESTLFIVLRPVNYIVSPNEDIFEYIKRDILAYLVKEQEYQEIDWKQALSEIYNYDTILECVDGIADLIGPKGKLLLMPFYWFKKIDDKYAIDKYFDCFKFTRGGLFEFDNFSFAIQTTLTSIKENGRRNVLIIEDLDRIDPEHLFRILNVLGAHIDEDDETNKFGFDNIVAVLDYDTTRHVFHHFYGQKANYDGYMAKFMSHNPFYYSVTQNAHTLLLQFLRDRCKLTDEILKEPILIDKQVNNISIEDKITNLTIREIDQILSTLEDQFNGDDYVLANGNKIKSVVPLCILLAILVRMRVGVKKYDLINVLSRKLEHLLLFGGFVLTTNGVYTEVGGRQYYLNQKIVDGYAEVEWQWFVGGTRTPIQVTDLARKSLEIVMSRVYDCQHLFNGFYA